MLILHFRWIKHRRIHCTAHVPSHWVASLNVLCFSPYSNGLCFSPYSHVLVPVNVGVGEVETVAGGHCTIQ